MMHEFHAVVLHPDGSIKHDILLKRHVFPYEDVGRAVPVTLMYMADWIADITTGKVLKRRTKDDIYLHLCAQEVDHPWLVKHGYARSARI